MQRSLDRSASVGSVSSSIQEAGGALPLSIQTTTSSSNDIITGKLCIYAHKLTNSYEKVDC